ncbi:hypothetical protein PMAYCL1PPCAC_07886 [Pristionchus mayeri]|uniref:Uncharacterized protein n=1 Tax=Pristionchus mayeri TaxID=1317129 RepID=A0AAN4ZEL8_9BILA|nr:hypothetical protein PMAYCL1PPCAC_07886 [Pristionchus mayeri]
MEHLEERLDAIERALGLDEHPQAKAKDFDVPALRKDLVDRGFQRIFNIPSEKLKRLHELMHKTESRPLGEKLNSIQFCEELINQRAEQLKAFQEMSEVVLNSEAISAVGNHSVALDQMQKEVEEAIAIWKEVSSELDDFRADLTALMTSLHLKVAELERAVAAKEKK